MKIDCEVMYGLSNLIGMSCKSVKIKSTRTLAMISKMKICPEVN